MMKILKVKKNYENYLTILSGITGITPREFELLSIINLHNIVVIDSSTKEIIANTLGIKRATLNIMLIAMMNKNLLVKISHGVYEAHPILKEIYDLKIIFDG